MNLDLLPFTVRQLQYAVAVSETLNFRKAAERCHVAQPSLSAQIADLERALDVRLFERDRRRVLVTPAGSAILERARIVLQAAADLGAVARRSGDPLGGTLRLGVIPTISAYLLPRITKRFRRRHPNLTALWTEDKTEVLVDRLSKGELDAAVVALEAEIGDVEHAVIAFDPFVLAAPTDHPLATGSRPLKPSRLSDQSVLLLDDGHCFRDQALAVCSGAKAEELEFRATSLPTLAQMVAGGAGITLLPELCVPIETKRADLVVRRFSKPEPGRTLALIWRPHSPLRPALEELATTIRTGYGKATSRTLNVAPRPLP